MGLFFQFFTAKTQGRKVTQGNTFWEISLLVKDIHYEPLRLRASGVKIQLIGPSQDVTRLSVVLTGFQKEFYR